MSEGKATNSGVVTSIADTDLVMVVGSQGGYHPISFANLMKAVKGGIQIGGRNLLRNTGTWGSGWDNQSGTHVIGPDKYQGLTVLHFDDAKPWNGMNQAVNIKPGEIFALSFFCKAGTAGTIGIRIMSGTVDNPFIFNVPTDEWKRCTLVTSLSQTASQLRMEIGTGSAKGVCFCGVKLERGNMATDWTPAPEDIASGTWGGGKSKIYNHLQSKLGSRAERRAA